MAKPVLKEIIIDKEWCKGCGFCIHFCPEDVLELDEDEKADAPRPTDCICCRQCEYRCPDLAIEIDVEDDTEPEDASEDHTIS